MFDFSSDYDPVTPTTGELLAEIGLDTRAVRDALADDRALPRPGGPAGREIEGGLWRR